MFRIKRENTADSPDNLVRVAEKIKHREDHHEQIENERRDIAQDRAEALREKTRLLLNALGQHFQHIGVGIQARHMVCDPVPAFRQHGRLLHQQGMLHAP